MTPHRGADSVRKFYREIAIRRLAVRLDPTAVALSTLGVVGLPTTPIIDGQGWEIGGRPGRRNWARRR